MKLEYDDGGRAAAGFRGEAGDCTVRAIAIATEQPYRAVYDALFAANRERAANSRRPSKRGSSPRNRGTSIRTTRAYLEALGWTWVATMKIGTGCRVHLRADELPSDRLIVRLSRHMTTVIDGVIHDIYDPSRDETRCVYGYFEKRPAE